MIYNPKDRYVADGIAILSDETLPELIRRLPPVYDRYLNSKMAPEMLMYVSDDGLMGRDEEHRALLERWLSKASVVDKKDLIDAVILYQNAAGGIAKILRREKEVQ